jgi:hypothetical protein
LLPLFYYYSYNHLSIIFDHNRSHSRSAIFFVVGCFPHCLYYVDPRMGHLFLFRLFDFDSDFDLSKLSPPIFILFN